MRFLISVYSFHYFLILKIKGYNFYPFQGNYIKSLPLHHTQQILIDNEDECK